MSVPFFRGADSIRADWDRIEARIDEAVDAGRLVSGPLVDQLERAVERYTGVAHAVAVASGTDALILALEACDVPPDSEVVVPVYTFFATASSVVHAGARPVFVDIEPDTYAMDPAAVEAAIGPHTSAVMPVHLFNQMADMPRIAEIAERHGVSVIEDSAEAIGMTQLGRHAGRFGRAGVLSFFPTKTLGAVGDAGMLLTDDADVARAARSLRHHGQALGETPYTWERLGWNSRMDDIQAAVLLTRLETLERAIERRAALVRRYDERLADLAGHVSVPRVLARHDARPVHYVYLIEAEDRDGLVRHLADRSVETEVYYPRPLHLQPCFADLGYGEGDFPVAERAAGRAVALPLYPTLADADVDAVCDAVAAFYQRRAAPRPVSTSS
jgi:dTDP-4-amino-4,6-dideoxygalactose transaminase